MSVLKAIKFFLTKILIFILLTPNISLIYFNTYAIILCTLNILPVLYFCNIYILSVYCRLYSTLLCLASCIIVYFKIILLSKPLKYMH